ncbi:hypothetical protein GCM10007094_32020 [Pseudovibrio japonicus]|uniref:Mercuric transport protein MerT n=1 Tax=Pseudovibrio japonicus TaxID=366534 RepID=A0ABQ3EHQ7_9HYPH|nr:hypothetical protein GCM10007094_32020 [Pseudovibrio japonicus]
MGRYLSLSYLSSIGALGVATCCVLPIILLLLGLGGSWVAVFGKVAAASYYMLAVSTLMILTAWVASFRRDSLGKLRWKLGGATAMTVAAWLLVANETRINDFLIRQM